MSLTPSQFKAALPEFGGVEVTVIQRFLDQAARNLASAVWEDRYDDGQLYLTAHLVSTFGSNGSAGDASGPITSKRVGEVSASYAVGEAFKESALGVTKYGRQYLELRALVAPAACRCLL